MQEHRPLARLDWSTSAGQGLTEDERRLVASYVRPTQTLDLEALSLLREDLRFAMPPLSGIWVDRNLIGMTCQDGGVGRVEYGDTAVNQWPHHLRTSRDVAPANHANGRRVERGHEFR